MDTPTLLVDDHEERHVHVPSFDITRVYGDALKCGVHVPSFDIRSHIIWFNTIFATTLSPDLSPCRRQGSAELHIPEDLRLPPLARLTAHD